VDKGVSGGSDLGDRPALVAAVGELRAAGAGVLVVAKRDRLARDVYVAATIERAVSQCGARVIAADGTANGDTAADAFMRTILDGAAAYERALIRSRTRAALAAKRAKGERVGTVPFGFEATADGALVANAAEQTAIAEARALRASGYATRRRQRASGEGDHVAQGPSPRRFAGPRHSQPRRVGRRVHAAGANRRPRAVEPQ
jgi:DNA invertase Pin-like site-specific DNA recombinase